MLILRLPHSFQKFLVDSDEEEGEGGSSSALLQKRTKSKEEKVGALESCMSYFLLFGVLAEMGQNSGAWLLGERRNPSSSLLLASYLPENCHLFG